MDVSQVPNFNSSNELSLEEIEALEQPRPNKRQRVFNFSEKRFESLQKFFQFKSTSNSTEDIKLIYLCKYDNKCSGRVQIWLPSDTEKGNVQTSVSHQSSHYIPQLKIYLTITKDDNGLIRLSDQTMGLHWYVSVPD
ncbi:hypothetical protein BLOT_008449 [Blomia tropicalis]|nr:hypothetical protein BLOT_008449 [Blomia tropicalis]